MASRSQMRLAQITGSLSSVENEIAALSTDSLQGVMDHLASAIKRITGGSAYHSQAAGLFSQDLDINGKIDVLNDISGSAHLMVSQNSDLKGTLDVAGEAVFAASVDAAVNVLAGGEFRGDLQYSASAGAGIDMTADFKNAANVVISLNDAYTQALFAEADTTSIDMGYEIVNGVGTFSGSVKLDTDALHVSETGVDLKDEISGNRTFLANVDVDGTFNADGAVTLAAAGTLTDIRGTLSVDEAATFDSNVTITGNLTVNGTTTTVNTEEVTIADHNIVIDSNNSTEAIINGAGFTFDGGSGDDLTFQWNSSDLDMELKLGEAFAKLHIGDLAAADIDVDGVANIDDLYVDNNLYVSGASELAGAAQFLSTIDVDGQATVAKIYSEGAMYVSGAAELASAAQFLSTIDVDGTATLAEAIIEDLEQGRIVITDPASKQLSSSADFYYSGDQMFVGSNIIMDASDATVEANKFYIEDSGNKLEIVSNELHIVSDDNMMLDSAGSIILDSATGGIALQTGGSDFGTIAYQGSEMWVASNTEPLNILAGTVLHMSGTVVDFSDDYRPGSWSAPIKLAGSADDWTNYEAALGGELSLLAGITKAAAGSVNAGKWTKVYADGVSTVSAGTAIALSGFTDLGSSIACDTAVAASNAKAIDVYVNGQLMLEGASNDFEISSGNIDFSFDIEGGDVIQIVVR